MPAALAAVAINGFALTGTTIFRQANGASYNGLNPTLLSGSSAVLGASLDPEGVTRLPSGNLLVSDEYGPSVYEFTAAGQFVRAFQTPANLVPAAGGRPGPGRAGGAGQSGTRRARLAPSMPAADKASPPAQHRSAHRAAASPGSGRCRGP